MSANGSPLSSVRPRVLGADVWNNSTFYSVLHLFKASVFQVALLGY